MIIAPASLFGVLQNQGLVTLETVPSIGKEVVELEELGTATGAFEMLAGGVLGAAANFGAASRQ